MADGLDITEQWSNTEKFVWVEEYLEVQDLKAIP